MNTHNQRGNNRGQNNRQNWEQDPFNDMMMDDDFNDPFGNMMQEFRMPHFGGGFGHMGNFFGGMGNFGNMEQQMFSMNSGMGGNNGTVITKSYVSKKNYNANGEPEEENYQSQSIQQIGKDGRKMHEKSEAYKNSRSGIEKASHQRMLDDKGQKCMRQRNHKTGEKEEHNMYKGINEEELNDFNKEYNDYRNKVNFQKNYKMLNQGSASLQRQAIGSGNTNSNANPNDRHKPSKKSSHNKQKNYLPKGDQ